MAYKVAIIGNGYVGKGYRQMFPDAVVYDEPQGLYADKGLTIEAGREVVNGCDMALVCVPTNPTPEGELDMSIVEEVVGWLDTPLILIKSALQPGTVDRLVKQHGKRIAVSVEMIGEGKYFVPYWKYPDAEDPRKHQFLVVGGEEETAKRCADVLWDKMSPDIAIHLVTAVEAEICKLMENTWGALKVTYANTIYDLCEAMGANYTRVLQAWGSDGRTEKMHMRVVGAKRGWKSKCWDKDIPAMRAALKEFGVNDRLVAGLINANKQHLADNE